MSRATGLTAAHPDLAWVADVLWGPDALVSLGTARAAPELETYLIVPSARRPRLLLPADGHAAFGAARAGTRLRPPRVRAERAAVAWLARARVDRFVFRDRLVVHDTPPGADRRLVDALGDVVGERVSIAVNVRPPGPYRKPVVQAMTRDGRVVAYAKVAWNRLTDVNVGAEAGALRAVAASRQISAPRVIGELEWRDHVVLVTAPMPRMLRRFPSEHGPPGPEITHEVATLVGSATSRFDRSGARARLRDRLASVVASGVRPAVTEGVSDLVDGLDTSASTDVAVGSWHGDWSPWNLALEGARVWAWDWEFSRADVPLGLDIPHFHLQARFIGRRRGFAESVDRAHIAAAPALSELGWDRTGRRIVRGVHVAEIALRYLEAEANGARANPRFVAEAVPTLRAEADRAAG